MISLKAKTWEKTNKQVHRCCWLCLSHRNVGAGHVARAASSAGQHDHASRLRMWSAVSHGFLVFAWPEPPNAGFADVPCGVQGRFAVGGIEAPSNRRPRFQSDEYRHIASCMSALFKTIPDIADSFNHTVEGIRARKMAHKNRNCG